MEREIVLPISTEAAKELRIGDILYLTGKIYTARDEAHHQMLEHHKEDKPLPFDPASMALFHCGPVVRKAGDGWDVIAAGPTTSVRMELFEDRFLETFGTKIVIGKGGMGEKTQAALQKCGAVYTHYTGGAGALAARAIERIADVYWLEELGMPEAVWIFRVNRFGPLLVTMDSAGGNLYTDLKKTIAKNQQEIHAEIAAG
jgi:tartrate/fumarate subfamily iron-sulfur-dependent hydro-lyase beta chain